MFPGVPLARFLFTEAWRRDFRPAVTLCRCPCHGRCPATVDGHVRLQDWAASCTCAGSDAEKERARTCLQDYGATLNDVKRESERNIAKRREAMAAAQERARGCSGEEARRILVEEYTSRGLKVPDEEALDLLAGSLVNPGALHAAGLAIRMFAGLAREARNIAEIFRGVERIRGPEGSDAYFVPPDHTRPMVDVILDPEAGSVLPASDGRPGPGFMFPVWLERLNGAGSGPAAVSVRTEHGRIGMLSADDSKIYEYALRDAETSGRTLTVMATLRRGLEGGPRVRVFPAGTEWRPRFFR